MAVAFGLADSAYSTIDAADAAGASATTTAAATKIPASTRLTFPMVPSQGCEASTLTRNHAAGLRR